MSTWNSAPSTAARTPEMNQKLPLACVLTLAACTPKESGPQLWKKACAHTLSRSPDTTPQDQATCEQDMASHPPAVSNDMSRCILAIAVSETRPQEKSKFDACVSEATQVYLNKLGEAHDLLGELGEQIDAYQREKGAVPETLAAIGRGQTRDPWGHPVHYRPTEGHYELCIVGPDGRHGTADDRCHQPFIFFQF